MSYETPIKCPKCGCDDVFYDGDSKRLKCMECNFTGTEEEANHGNNTTGIN